ncbi:hypothetical protein HZA97_07210 [Candidatus Woesearchaeota archaeon]|nr:hypothetical protein [Candidatus Woesearchaeota archaeon]
MIVKKENIVDLRKAFISSVYEVLDDVVSPTPYVLLKEKDDKVDVRFLNGCGMLPSKNGVEFTVLDFLLGGMFLDRALPLFVGCTGAGKTFTVDGLCGAVFGNGGYDTLRLSSGVMGCSPLELFTDNILDNDMPKTVLNLEKCAKYGAVLLDEVNRGESNEVLQVVDSKINVNGDVGYLRIPIPGTDRFKRLYVVGAMNPPDAQYTGALELDLAGENRFLKMDFPNGVEEAGSTQLDKRVIGELHDKFWNLFREKTGLNGGWREWYPVVTDSETLGVDLDEECREAIDVLLGYVGKNPVESFERNKALMENGGYTPKFKVNKSNDLTRIVEIQKGLKHGFVRRDLGKIRDLSCVLAFIKSIKNDSYTPQVSLQDVIAGIGIVLEGKRATGVDSSGLMSLVNDGLSAYKKMKPFFEGFGFRQAVYQSSVHAGRTGGFDAFSNTLQKNIESLNISNNGGVADSVIRSRVLADLVVLDYFSKQYQSEVVTALKAEDPLNNFKEVYEAHKKDASVYEHRLGAIIR